MARRSSTAPVERHTYVLEADRELPVEEQSVWHFRPMTFGERLRELDLLATSVGKDEYQRAGEALLAYLVEVERFPADAPQPYPTKGTREEKEQYLSALRPSFVYELGAHVLRHGTLGPPEKKS